MKIKSIFALSILLICGPMLSFVKEKAWSSKFLQLNKDASITYFPDEKGNTIPDFSLVGYHHGEKDLPRVKIVKTVEPVKGDAGTAIQSAINEVSALPVGKDGFRGAILLKKGDYSIAGAINIHTDGIVLMGEGNTAQGTRLIAAGKGSRSLLKVSGKGRITESGNRVKITDAYVPAGAKSFQVSSAKQFKAGDRIIVYRPGTDNWIHDLKMDQIVERDGTRQWKANEYNLSYEREITAVNGNKISIDNPIVMALDQQYGGGEVFKYDYNGRIKEVGIENILFESEYAGDTDEDHGWVAVDFDHIENGWISNVTSRFFGFGCVSLNSGAKNITVKKSRCFDAKSIITGSRRYSFNNNGQQNLFIDLETTEGRHDYVTGAKTCGPNVFYRSKSRNTHADIGPHHRWSSGTLYDNIDTDGEINVQDRGNWGSGHGWAGVTQVIWNCKVKAAAIQSPWVSGKNYAIGVQGLKVKGRLGDKPDGEWEGQYKTDLQPASLYEAQLKARGVKAPI
ncbi:hypothetical protein [Pedobacter heparinus]|uniref:Pectate lyase superfamily protein domain-containing protein n=1 Tax=Pedobacter heparinus (strain ATCC 13125 / DSM 2366 / CIP 104194 / JCM 7457 / NBRC 12017 / NCIMB 9290 / NRRL B-14731 / HIM 762-3) TaxID=485917 RepID=C6Y0W1_PEDHD|nr:hypothetical protein [Pedobacter heparinus]ACU04888.1 conserved hypothetical protein [Pedobacter heparinus DSM 2366]